MSFKYRDVDDLCAVRDTNKVLATNREIINVVSRIQYALDNSSEDTGAAERALDDLYSHFDDARDYVEELKIGINSLKEEIDDLQATLDIIIDEHPRKFIMSMAMSDEILRWCRETFEPDSFLYTEYNKQSFYAFHNDTDEVAFKLKWSEHEII